MCMFVGLTWFDSVFLGVPGFCLANLRVYVPSIFDHSFVGRRSKDRSVWHCQLSVRCEMDPAVFNLTLIEFWWLQFWAQTTLNKSISDRRSDDFTQVSPKISSGCASLDLWYFFGRKMVIQKPKVP